MKQHADLESHIHSTTPLNPAIQAWEIYLQDQDKSPFTVKAFLNDMQLLATYLPPDKAIGSITTNDLNLFLKWLQTGRGVPCSPKSLSRRITTLKAFFRWLHNNGRISVNPAEKVVQKSVISPLPVILTAEETEMVLQVANQYRTASKPDARFYTLLKLLLETGIKKGECLMIGLNHIDLTSPNGPFVFVRYNNPNYRYKERKINVSNEWVEAYQEYLSQYNPKEKVFPWSPRRLEYILEDISKEAKLEKHLSFDMCRWTCAVNDYNSEMERDAIRQKLGISKIQWREIGQKLARLTN
ncbi:MAG TPA: tyrosine-type recombinase/integrase [Anaerolineaceae bacterium]|nr:tyrosine-type recombinase/integrase [Anaerolineaceae bacterium]